MHGESSQYAWILSDEEKLKAKRHAMQTMDKLSKLTPAGKRLLSLMLTTYNMNWGASINRKQIAGLLGRSSGGLTPYDRRLLDKLCELGFLSYERETLWTSDLSSPRGAEYRYSMDEDTGWVLNQIRKANRNRIKKAG